MKKFLIILVSVLLLAGCKNTKIEECNTGWSLENGVCVEDIELEGIFTSSDEIVELFRYFNDNQNLLNQQFGWNALSVDMEMDTLDGAPTATSDENTSKGSDDYSETNNQVDGVDEMDNVLTDGKYIYIQNYNKIQIVLAYTVDDEYEALELVKEISFDSLETENSYFYFSGMYVDDDRLLVVGNYYTYYCNGTYESKTVTPDETRETGDSGDTDDVEVYYDQCSYYESHSYTQILEYSKDDFEILNTYKLSGYFVGSRKINDDLYFVTNEYIPFYLDEYEDYDFSIDTYIPSYMINDEETELSYEDIVYIDGTNPVNFTTFYGIDLETQDVSTEVILGEGGYNLYVSTENIYLTGTKWDYNEAIMLDIEVALDSDEEIEITENPYEITTSIIKISIDNGLVDYVADGEVPGVTLDQFSMDEYNGNVRIVTTTNNWWWWNSETDINNRLMILDEDLNVVSTLENLGKEGESVQATRFSGDYAYVVTFLRTDPFYVIDLSDPLNPTKLSELEIPGFSDYLQPIGSNHILGIGYGDEDGGTQGLKISLYDISDKSNAVVASEIVYPYNNNSYMWTSTVYNHKDLLISVSKGIIALPYTLNDYSGEDNYNWSYHTGVLVINLDLENGEITERARVEHSETNSYDTYVYKSKLISDYIYTISSKYVMVSSILDPETVLKQVQIGESRDIYYPEVTVDPVEPTDPIDPDNPDVTNPSIFDEFIHLETWDKVLGQEETEYLVYAYNDTCDFCEEVNIEILDYAIEDDYLPIYFINTSSIDVEGIMVDAIPSLLLISDNEVIEEYVGTDEISDYLVH